MKEDIKVVIADDNQNIRDMLREILLEKKYSVDTVEDGNDLLGYLKENSPHVIILDLMMPEKDGIEVFNSIKCISPAAKVIIYTAFPRYEDSFALYSADKFLMKSSDPEKLLNAIKDLV